MDDALLEHERECQKRYHAIYEAMTQLRERLAAIEVKLSQQGRISWLILAGILALAVKEVWLG